MGELDVRVVLTAAADQLRKELGQVGKDAETFGARLSRSMNSASEGLRRVGKTMSIGITAPLAAAATGAVAAVKKFAGAGDQIAQAAGRIGISARDLQGLRFVGEQFGADQQTVDMALQRFSRRLGEAANGGGELVDTLAKYGIAVKDAHGNTRPVMGVFGDLADAIEGADSQSEQLAIAFKAFDSEGATLVNALRGGSDEVQRLTGRFDDLGLGMSGKAVKASEAFTKQWKEAEEGLKAAGIAVGEALLPALTELMPFVSDTVIPGIRKIGEGVADAIKWFNRLSPEVKTTAAVVAGAIGVGGPILVAVGFLVGAIAALASPVGIVLVSIAAIGAAWVAWGDKIRAAIGGTITWLQETFTVFREWWTEFWSGFFGGFRETFGAGVQWIRDSTTGVIESLKSTWQGFGDFMVFDSLIPDMWNAIIAYFQQGGNAIAKSSARTASTTTKSFASMANDAAANFQAMFQAFSQHSKAMFIASQAAGIAQALIATYQGIAEALKLGWPLGPIAAAKIAVIGFAQVAAIAATTFSSSGGGGGGRRGGSISGGGSAGLVGAASAPPPAPAPAPAGAYEAGRLEATITIESRRRTFGREDIEDIFEGLNELLEDNAVLRVRFA